MEYTFKVFDWSTAEWERRIYLHQFWFSNRFPSSLTFTLLGFRHKHSGDFRCISMTLLNFQIEYITCLSNQTKVIRDSETNAVQPQK